MDDSLTSFIEEVYGDSHLRVEDDLGDGFVRLKSSEAERRQAKHDIRSTEDIVIEMLRNARDAGARNIFLASSREANMRRLTMVDDGSGVPENMHEAIFKPRVTSKLDTMHIDKWGVHGRGMALYSVSVNAQQAYIASSEPGKGSAFVVVSDTNTIAEKTDQSTLPSFNYVEGELQVRGPHNINRCVAEFAYESMDTCNVFYGSPVEIAATLYAFGEATVSKAMRVFAADDSSFSLPKRLCLSVEPDTFVDAAKTLGLELSERSARRILDGDIKALPAVDESFEFTKSPARGSNNLSQAARKKRLLKDARGLKIHDLDLEEFSNKIKEAYKDLAQGYYLEPDVSIKIHVSSSEITVSIPFSKIR